MLYFLTLMSSLLTFLLNYFWNTLDRIWWYRLDKRFGAKPKLLDQSSAESNFSPLKRLSVFLPLVAGCDVYPVGPEGRRPDRQPRAERGGSESFGWSYQADLSRSAAPVRSEHHRTPHSHPGRSLRLDGEERSVGDSHPAASKGSSSSQLLKETRHRNPSRSAVSNLPHSVNRWASPWSPSYRSCRPPSWRRCRIPAARWGWGPPRLWVSWSPSTPRWTRSSPSSSQLSATPRTLESGVHSGQQVRICLGHFYLFIFSNNLTLFFNRFVPYCNIHNNKFSDFLSFFKCPDWLWSNQNCCLDAEKKPDWCTFTTGLIYLRVKPY